MRSGSPLVEQNLSGRDRLTGQQPREAVKGFDMETGLPDVLSSDGEYIFMRDLAFNAQLEPAPGVLRRHLFSPTGFLDNTWWHRSYWLLGEQFQAGWGGWHQVGNQVPAGRLLCFDDERIVGFGRNFYPKGNAGQWKTGEYYRTFSAEKVPTAVENAPATDRRGRPIPPRTQVQYHWDLPSTCEARALLLADQHVVVAGPLGPTHASVTAFEGHEGIVMQRVDATTGELLQTIGLDEMPVVDGMIAARGQVFLATELGSVLAFRQE